MNAEQTRPGTSYRTLSEPDRSRRDQPQAPDPNLGPRSDTGPKVFTREGVGNCWQFGWICRETPTPAPADPAIPAVTLRDLAAFTPARPALTIEPDHVGIAGLPLNLVATVGTQTLQGSLFQNPVTVRFTPHHYDWSHGDGTTATTSSPGTTWASSRDPQFTPTATSHTYRDRGRYPVSVTVSYTAAVSFDGTGWQTVDGYVRATSSTETVRILEARTALVAHTCIEDPHGPGC